MPVDIKLDMTAHYACSLHMGSHALSNNLQMNPLLSVIFMNFCAQETVRNWLFQYYKLEVVVLTGTGTLNELRLKSRTSLTFPPFVILKINLHYSRLGNNTVCTGSPCASGITLFCSIRVHE